MKIFSSLVAIALVSMLAGAAQASFGGGGKKDDSPAASSSNPSAEQTPRQQAEMWYGDAYDDVQKADKDLASGKTGNAEKKLHRAIDRAQRAIELDSTYHEAWNLVGYASRKLKDYDRALAAYDRCLHLKSDYAPAHEYRGEAYLELGRIDDARKELATLAQLEAHQDAETLQTAIDAWTKAHPQAEAAATPASTTAGK